MVEVVWSEAAGLDLVAIHRVIAGTSKAVADAWATRLLRRADQLAAFPDMGRVIPELQSPLLRELMETPYRILYERFPDRVEILAVAHGKQMLVPPPLEPTGP